MLGHPSRNPRRTALRRVDIFGLHNDWCANLTAFAFVFVECVKLATCGAPLCASAGTMMCVFVALPTGFTLVVFVCSCFGPIGRVHRSVDGSFFPFKMTFPLYQTSQFVFVKTTSHPALHSTLIPIKDAIDNLGTTCPTNIIGSPGIVMSHVCVDFTFVPSGRFIVSGRIAGWRFLQGVPSMMNIEVAPVSAIASDVAMVNALRYCGFGAPNRSLAVAAIDLLMVACTLCTFGASCVRFEVMIVMSSSSLVVVTLMIWVGSEVSLA